MVSNGTEKNTSQYYTISQNVAT